MFSNVGYLNIDGLKAAEKSQNENCQKTLTPKPGLKEMKFVPIWRTSQKKVIRLIFNDWNWLEIGNFQRKGGGGEGGGGERKIIKGELDTMRAYI